MAGHFGSRNRERIFGDDYIAHLRIVVAAPGRCIQRHEVRKTMQKTFAAPWIDVHIASNLVRSETVKYEFTLVLKGIHELTDDLADELFSAGCDDGTPGTCDGVFTIDFHREATSLEDAIRSAIGNVQTTGHEVERVEIPAASVMQTA